MGKSIKLLLIFMIAALFTGAGYYMGTRNTDSPAIPAGNGKQKTSASVEKNDGGIISVS